MDADAKKTALRMIPYGIYVLTAEAPDGSFAAATVNWVTQTSFVPPLVVVGVKADSSAHAVVTQARQFGLSILGKGQQDVAFKFFKAVQRDGESVAGEPLVRGADGIPLLAGAAAAVACRVVEVVPGGDHSVVVAEVIEARVARVPEGRPDDAVLLMKDLGEKVFYGG